MLTANLRTSKGIADAHIVVSLTLKSDVSWTTILKLSILVQPNCALTYLILYTPGPVDVLNIPDEILVVTFGCVLSPFTSWI